MIRLSIIIPTRDRAGMLRDCLESLCAQTAPHDALEVVVVDDGSVDETPAVVRSFAGRSLEIRHQRQAPAGLNAGRNNGAARARGPLLAYLDDDTLVAPDWAAAVLAAFDEGYDAIAGRLTLRFEAPRPRWLAPSLETFLSGLDLGSVPRVIAPPLIPYGANCAVSRRAFDRVGGFGAGLDREGSSLLSNGDKDFFFRVHASGGRTVWWPGAAVLHRVPPERLTKAWFRRRAWWQGVSDGLTDRLPGVSPAAATAREAVRACRSVPILAANLARGRGGLTAELWLRYSAGRAAGARRTRGEPHAPAPHGAVATP